MKNILQILLCIFLLQFSIEPGLAETTVKPSKAEAQRQLKALKNKIKKARTNLQANKSRYSNAVNQLKNIEKEVAIASAKLVKVKRQLKAVSKKLDSLNTRKTALFKNKLRQQKALAQQLRAAYGTGNEEYLKLLLNQTDPVELGRMLTYFSYLNEARSKEITALSETLTALKKVSVEIDQQRARLDRLLQQRQKQVAILDKKQRQRKKIADNWQSKVVSSDSRLSSLLANEKELQSIIDAVREAIEVFMPGELLKGLGRLKRKLRWPVAGKIIRKYGSSRHSGNMRWHGVLISAREGKSVHAISSGRVVFSDWLRGYGLLLIIDHGEKYLTLYGHNQTLLKQVGDWVEPGEVISLVGNTGGQGKAALYFEMRHKNKPVNPAFWCR